MPITARESQILTPAEWQSRRGRHVQRVDGLLADYSDARSRHIKDPVLDFLFGYYNFRLGTLRRWSPGFRCRLAGPDAQAALAHFPTVVDGDGAGLDLTAFPGHRRKTLRWVRELLRATASRAPQFSCCGMHEWAMLYRAADRRHAQIPLRLPQSEIDAFVESRPIVCTHYDAFRFFTPAAVPLNTVAVHENNRHATEQPACLHVSMDLYKWAYKFYPWIGSDQILAGFELAIEARQLDMQASPYDMAGCGIEPIPVETVEGRNTYVARQRELREAAAPVRTALVTELAALETAIGDAAV